jgi:hypothetical protein
MQSIRVSLFAAALSAMSVAAYADDTGFGYMHDLTKSGARTCFASHFHAGHGDGATKPAALKAALRDWWSYTAGEYGSDWAHWGRSASKGIKYTKTDSGWSATVESRPCK